MSTKKNTAILAVLLTLGLAGRAQSQNFSFDFHGFVNPHFYADSRAVVGGREDMMLFYPLPVVNDSNGYDINDGWQANMLAITARLGLRISGPDMLGARTSAYIEGDFTGATNATIDNLRLRHAYIDMLWNGDGQGGSHRLIMGQYWYAMVVHEIMPMTNPLNMGAPFHCYARQPQVRYEYSFNHLQAVAAAQWQLDNMSKGLLNGEEASSTLFARHSMVPELNIQLRYSNGAMLLGIAANAKTIQPIVPDPEGSLHTSLSWSLFGKARLGDITVKAQTLINNSLYEGCSLGGYLIMDDGSFRDWHFNTVWVDIERATGHWRPGIFLGAAKNNDFGNSDFAHCLGRGHDIKHLWRVQPRLTYTTTTGLAITAEAEYTCAAYQQTVANTRLSMSVTYAF